MLSIGPMVTNTSLAIQNAAPLTMNTLFDGGGPEPVLINPNPIVPPEPEIDLLAMLGQVGLIALQQIQQKNDLQRTKDAIKKVEEDLFNKNAAPTEPNPFTAPINK